MSSIDDRIEKIERQRQAGKIGLRIIDTNVAISNSDFIYLLSGNIPLIPGFEEAMRNNKVSARLLKAFDKKPHDLLIPNHVRVELDDVKSNPKKETYARVGASSALKAIHRVMHEYLDHSAISPGNGLLTGNMPITLPNGANIYFQDITPEELKVHYNSASEANGDTIIIASGLEFLKNHGYYENIRFITDDVGAGDISLLLGIRDAPFRFNTIKNPLQLYKGITYVDVDHKTLRKSRAKMRSEIDPMRNDLGIRIKPKSLKPNQVVGVRTKANHRKDRDPDGVDSKYSWNFMIWVPDRKILRRTIHYDDFMSFYTTNRVNIKDEEKEEKDPFISELDALFKVRPPVYDNIEKILAHIKDYLSEKKFNEFSNRNKEADTIRKDITRLNKAKRIRSSIRKYCRKELDLWGTKEEKNKHGSGGLLWLPFNQKLVPAGEQIPYIDHLANPDLSPVSIEAKGGFGKTLWPMAVGLYHLHHGRYNELAYLASMASIESDLGPMPGGKEKKIEHKVKPGYNTLIKLFTNPNVKLSKTGKLINDLVTKRKVILDVISEYKGMTVENTYGIIDEFHLLDLDQAGMTIGRFADNSKVVCLSASEQRGASTKRYVNEHNAGIAHLVERCTGIPYYAHISPLPYDVNARGKHARIATHLTDRTAGIISNVRR